MPNTIAHVTFLVHDYDEAITWFCSALNFNLFEDQALGGTKRWVVVGPPTDVGARILLAKADNAEQISHIGKAAGGRVAYFLNTDNFVRDHKHMLAQRVQFNEEPRHEAYGTVAVFSDLYGNKWDLLQRK